MIKLNNKGMAISGILYTILVLFIVLLFGILSLLSSSKYTFEKIKSDVVEKIDGTQAVGVTANECFDFDYSTGTITSYSTTSPLCGSDVVIPETIEGSLVKKIAAKAFYNKDLTSVDFSKAVYLESIENGTATTGAFASNKIEKVTFGKNMYLNNIGNFAFYKNAISDNLDLSTLTSLSKIGEAAFNNNKISSVNFNNLFSLTSIGVGAFYGNVITGKLDLSSLSSLTTIGRFAFASNSITSVDTTNMISLVTIDQYAFHNNQIEVFDFRNLSALKTISNGAFSFNQLKNLDLSYTALTTINASAFSDNSIISVKFNDTLKTLGSYAFARNNISGALDLSDVSLTTFGSYAFFGNAITGLKYDGTSIGVGAFVSNSITSLDFNNLPNVTLIDEAAFYKNSTLTSVNFRNKPITTIGSIAFSDCGLTSIAIPSSVTMIGDSAFANNSISGTIDLSGNSGLTLSRLAFYNNQITNYELPTIMTSMGGGAFNLNKITDNAKKTIYARNEDGTENRSLIIGYAGEGGDKITISNEVTGITEYAFQSINASDIVFGDSIESIDNYAFAGFKITGDLDLSSMKNLKVIGEYAFASNSYVRTISNAEKLSTSTQTINTIGYKYNKYSTITVASSKFEDNTGYKSVNFSGLDKLETIENHAFYGNISLKKLYGLEDLVSLSTIGEAAFDGNYFETDIDLSNTKLVDIPSSAFASDKSRGGSGYGKLTLPETLTSIGADAFRYIRLASVEFPSNLKSIGNYAFSGDRFTVLDLPDSLEVIGSYAFTGNSPKTLVMPASLKSMGQAAFSTTSSLTSVDFSKTGPDFKSIPMLGFHNSGNLSKIILGNYVEEIQSEAFDWCKIEEIVIPASVKFIGSAFTSNRVAWKKVTILSNETNLDSRFDNEWIRIGWPSSIINDYDSDSYTLSTTDVNNFEYIGKPYEIEVSKTGTYKLEVWGAQGGDYIVNSITKLGGKGGYSTGEIELTKGDIIYVFVGGQPTDSKYLTSALLAGGFNGGGKGYVQTATNIYLGGGGATDIRIGSQSRYARVIVAGGGSGGSVYSVGNAGGGTSGIGYSGYFGTQTSAGTNAGFGYSFGAVGAYNSVIKVAAGGGGGFYGGGSQNKSDGSNGDKAPSMHGGGSGYVYTSSTASNYPSGCLLEAKHYLSNAKTITGNASMPSHATTGTMTGNSGNGYARITYIG